MHDAQLQPYYHYLAIFMSVMVCLTLLWIQIMKKYLRVAIGVIQEAAIMLQKIPTIFFPLPFIPIFLMFLLMYYWLWIASFLVSIRTEDLQIMYAGTVY
jgi:hypothetical protein